VKDGHSGNYTGRLFGLFPQLDKTGLSGSYDVTLDWAPDESSDFVKPPLMTAFRDQLGFRLRAARIPTLAAPFRTADSPDRRRPRLRP
jgi:uncharacterized protein (TIGR03435 family)